MTSFLLSGTYKTITSATSVGLGTRHLTVTPNSGGTVYCIAAVHDRCYGNSDLYGNGAECLFFSTKSFTLTNNDYASVSSVATATNGNGTTVYVGSAMGNNGGVSCSVGGTSLSVKIAVGDSTWNSMAIALSNFWV